MTFPVLFVCTCVLNYCHRVATQLQLTYIISEGMKCIKSVGEDLIGLYIAEFVIVGMRSSRLCNPQQHMSSKKGKVHPCTGTEALYRLYGPYGE